MASDNNPTGIIDKHFRVKCPHCATVSGLSAISIPRFELLRRYQPKTIGIAYQCDACRQTIFLRFPVTYDFGNARVFIDENFTEIERPKEEYEFNYLPEIVSDDFKEALTCYSHSCFNAFAAMCRRTIQSASAELGAEGTSKVVHQIEDLKAMSEIDDDTFQILKTIVIAGHDGAHPHLPTLSPERAEVLLELMKDVLYQLFVRKKKIQEANEKRKAVIQQKKDSQ
ncbi:MAG: DUF4145 domain-containing protein [Syntrophales bacterium]|nr:DUF4145 domain-containing protein [Syntrophales bacterium]MDD5640850.1 DUF4145 domain-containing protein [Syntrophales bacterium]